MIDLQNITKIYKTHNNNVISLNNVSIRIKEGEFTSIVGTSGSGKSTLMNILGTLDMQTSGKYYLNGVLVNRKNDLASIRNKHIGFIFQNFNLISKLNAVENVELPLIFAGIDKKKRRILAEISLEKVGLSHRFHHKPTEMSGGQQQRVAIARAIAMSPPIILADEPTGNLDPKSTSEVLEILNNLNLDGKTIVLITHDMKVANSAKRVIVLENGEILSEKNIKKT